MNKDPNLDSTAPQAKFTHVDTTGKANMVDVGDKSQSKRQAIAQGFVSVSPALMQQLVDNSLAKGDVLSVARVAGIQGAKQCSNLIPLCHPLMLSKVQIDFELQQQAMQVRIVCMCKLTGQTGVEMEALTGVSVAALTLFDMCKAVDPSMTIHGIKVLEKQGGKTGHWVNEA
ncbi:cyclic pyranopterin monophosphate synthase MoaC [Ningiella sp. W23]|uniref:cyclic pyranopterin monophosphate synthase MoaC n=1 Tax=Ningiella sp. W23 TaxID=3023715 RepID=UPI003757E2BB